MYKKNNNSLTKHWDFILLDLITMALVYFLVCVLYFNISSTVLTQDRFNTFSRLGVILLIIYLLTAVIGQNYKDILRRSRSDEFVKTLVQVVVSFILTTLYMFITQQFRLLSRIVFISSATVAIFAIWGLRCLLKSFLLRRYQATGKLPQALIISDMSHIEKCMAAISSSRLNPFFIKGIIINDEDRAGQVLCGKTVVCNKSDIGDYIVNEVVDGIFINIEDKVEANRLAKLFVEAGITIHIGITDLTDGLPNAMMEELGGQFVLTFAKNVATPLKLFLKRVIDIIGGFVGIIITGILYIFIAPQIKKKDPGPAMFVQTRGGQNGRHFKLYKFRSMYMDAEERKKELMAQNEMEGPMFKMENDPRILPGIGNFIREHSLDEFPQFINVFKGDLSLVGTRPPTLEEVEYYSLDQKSRLSFKPGITGLWQVSGRSNITDFDEIVRLDNEYIATWSIKLDIKIIIKTFGVIFKKDGAR